MPYPARYRATAAGSAAAAAGTICSTPPVTRLVKITVLPKSVTGGCSSAYRPPAPPSPVRPGTQPR